LIAEALAQRGHTVFATMRDPGGRNASNAGQIRELAQKESLPLHVVELDVTDEGSVERAARAAVEKAGRIDVAVNNAGYVVLGVAEAVTVEQAQRQMDTNFMGAVRVNRAVLPYMRMQRSGLLLHISSGAGRVVLPGSAFYCASKFAMEAMAEAYHYELAGQGIESSIVEPGAYKTAVFDNIVKAADSARTEAYGAMREVGSKTMERLEGMAGNPQDIADALIAIVETPAGQRKLRYRVSPQNLGIDEINAVCEEVQTRLLNALGLTEATRFAQRNVAQA
jgi:NAD(P)-dependent dehydrogenase (short-subunit alcohol dehydrogenase family)